MISMLFEIIHTPNTLDLMGHTIPAGYPSPAEDHLEGQLDIHSYLVRNPVSSFLMRVSGDSMKGIGIFDGDTIVVDRAINARCGHQIVARLQDEFVCKTFRLIQGKPYLYPENSQYKPITITSDIEFEIWGVVVASFRKHLPICLH